MKHVAVIASLAILCLGVGPRPTDPPFTHPIAMRAWREYQQKLNVAQETYDAAMTAAREGYLDGLKEAAVEAAKTGDLEQLKAISIAQDSATRVISPMPTGRWRVRYTSGTERVYWIHGNRISQISESGTKDQLIPRWRGTVYLTHFGHIVTFSDGKLERLTVAGDVLFVEHFNPASNFPEKFPTLLGRGLRDTGRQ